MRRVSEGLLLGESHLREASTYLLNGLAAVDLERPRSRSPKAVTATLKNIDLTRSYGQEHAGSGAAEPEPQFRRLQTFPMRVLSRAGTAGRKLRHLRGKFFHIRPISSRGGEAIR
jgi:hypothetical protein